MQLRNTTERYGLIAKGFHWITVALVVAMFGIAWYMESLPLGQQKVEFYNLHKSIGLTVFALTVLRLGWRHMDAPPPLPAGMPGWERIAARVSHVVLYIILLVQPLVGVVHSWAADFPVIVYGAFTLPSPMGPDDALKDALATVHWGLAWLLLATVAVHALAAIKHHVIDRDDVLVRMTFGRTAGHAGDSR